MTNPKIIEQAREAAAKHAANMVGMRAIAERIRLGDFDHHETVQSFFTLAQQMYAAGIEDAAKGLWQFDVQDADERRGRHVVAVVGFEEHSGRMWHRLHVDIAATCYEGRQGYVEEDIERIEGRGMMEPGSGQVVAWMDFITPPLTMDTRDLPPLPMPIRSLLPITNKDQGDE